MDEQNRSVTNPVSPAILLPALNLGIIALAVKMDLRRRPLGGGKDNGVDHRSPLNVLHQRN